MPPSKQASKPVDKAGESSETEEGSAPVRPEHWQEQEAEASNSVLHGKPWRIPRWVDMGKIQFRLAERNGKVAPLCNLPSLGLHEYPAREDHLGRLESISDPLTAASSSTSDSSSTTRPEGRHGARKEVSRRSRHGWSRRHLQAQVCVNEEDPQITTELSGPQPEEGPQRGPDA